MLYPARFVEDLKYLAQWYQWTKEDKEEIKKMFTGSQETVNFLMGLAAAHRAGYNEPAGNSFMTLERWCIEKEVPSPFKNNFTKFDLQEIDNLSVK